MFFTLQSINPIAGQSADTLLHRIFSPTDKLFHHLKMPLFKGRPYYLELFVDLPEDRIESVAIFIKTDNLMEYHEIPLEFYRGRYRFKYDPTLYPGKLFTYFFVVTTKDFGLYAIPLNDEGKIEPKTVYPVDPIKYYESLGY